MLFVRSSRSFHKLLKSIRDWRIDAGVKLAAMGVRKLTNFGVPHRRPKVRFWLSQLAKWAVVPLVALWWAWRPLVTHPQPEKECLS